MLHRHSHELIVHNLCTAQTHAWAYPHHVWTDTPTQDGPCTQRSWMSLLPVLLACVLLSIPPYQPQVTYMYITWLCVCVASCWRVVLLLYTASMSLPLTLDCMQCYSRNGSQVLYTIDVYDSCSKAIHPTIIHIYTNCVGILAESIGCMLKGKYRKWLLQYIHIIWSKQRSCFRA